MFVAVADEDVLEVTVLAVVAVATSSEMLLLLLLLLLPVLVVLEFDRAVPLAADMVGEALVVSTTWEDSSR